MSSAPSDTTETPYTDGILRISLISPDGAPTLDDLAMAHAVTQIENAGPEVGVILITHPGKNFCLGGNVSAFAGAEDPGPFVAAEAAAFHAAILALIASPLPVVAAVQGWAAGAGMSIAAASDIVIAGTGTKLRAAYPGIGFTPDGGMSWTLPRAVGRARALDIILTNRPVGADEALAIGLVSRVVADDQVATEAEAAAATLAAGSRSALAGIKRLINDGASRGLDEQLDAEAVSITSQAGSADGREGVRAFVERRPPVFSA